MQSMLVGHTDRKQNIIHHRFPFRELWSVLFAYDEFTYDEFTAESGHFTYIL